MSSKSKRGRLPFEPRQNKKKQSPTKAATENKTNAARSRQTAKSEASLSAIPDAVSKRMARRMALFCGVPSGVSPHSFSSSLMRSISASGEPIFITTIIKN